MSINLEDQITHKFGTRGYAYTAIKHGDLTAAALNETVTWATLVAANGGKNPPANAFIVNAWINLVQVFAGGAVATAVIDIGDAGTADEIVSAINIFTGAALGIKPRDGAYTFPTWETAYTPTVKVTTTTANVVALTTGKAELVLEWFKPETRTFLL